MVLHDFAAGTPYMLEGFVRTDQRDLLQRELYRCGTKRIAVHIADSISTFRNFSTDIATTIIWSRRRA